MTNMVTPHSVEFQEQEKILVLGATGYIGKRLVRTLLDGGCFVRAACRTPSKMAQSHPRLETIDADIADQGSLAAAMKGCSAAYYLVHSMTSKKKEFEDHDRMGAIHFASAAKYSGLQRILYLSGLGQSDSMLSKHLQSRHEVGALLQESGVPTTIFRAAMVIGSGSASFEILRYLVDRLPLMITPAWVRTPCQPISIVNVLVYLKKALRVPETIGKTFDIGGPEVTTYQKLMRLYAEIAQLKKRIVLPVRVLSPKLSSYWIGLITPLPPSLGKPLVEGLCNRVVCEEATIRSLIPQPLLSYREAMEQALSHQIDEHLIDSTDKRPPQWRDPSDPPWAGGTVFLEKRKTVMQQDPEIVYPQLFQLETESPSLLWRLRGKHLWKLWKSDFPKSISFLAQAKLPGKAILEFRMEKRTMECINRFFPKGLLGIFYWYAVLPFHAAAFSSLVRGIKKWIRM